MKKDYLEEKGIALEELYKNGRAKLLMLYKIAAVYYNCKIGGKEFGENHEDVVDGIVEKLLSGKRAWDVKEQPDAFKAVKSYIRSEVSNLLNKYTDKYDECIFDRDKDCDDIASENSGFDVEFGSDGKLRVYYDEKVFLNECRIDDAKQVLMMEGKEMEFDVFVRWCEDMKNKDIARELGVKVKEVSNAKKRVQRAIMNYKLGIMN